MHLRIIENKGITAHECGNPECKKPLTNKVLRITGDMINYLYICFDCLIKGIELNLDIKNR